MAYESHRTFTALFITQQFLVIIAVIECYLATEFQAVKFLTI